MAVPWGIMMHCLLCNSRLINPWRESIIKHEPFWHGNCYAVDPSPAIRELKAQLGRCVDFAAVCLFCLVLI